MYLNCVFPIKTTFIDYLDNEDYSIILYITGCNNNCKDCQNKFLQDKNYGEEIEVCELSDMIFKLGEKYKTNKIVLSGGDPLYKDNIDATKELLYYLYPFFDIMIYTGHDINYVKNNNINKFKYIKCNKYIPQYHQQFEKTDEYFKLASSNQKIYNNKYELLSKNGIYLFNN